MTRLVPIPRDSKWRNPREIRAGNEGVGIGRVSNDERRKWLLEETERERHDAVYHVYSEEGFFKYEIS